MNNKTTKIKIIIQDGDHYIRTQDLIRYFLKTKEANKEYQIAGLILDQLIEQLNIKEPEE